jgi:hypothetical protein
LRLPFRHIGIGFVGVYAGYSSGENEFPVKIWDLQSLVYVEVDMGTFPNTVAASREIHSYTKLREQIYRDPSLWSTYAELQRQIYRHPRLWRWDAVSQRSFPSSFTHLKKVAAIIIMLSCVLWLWFGVSTHHTPKASYPYYDTQKPVPPWSEPLPLKGNLDRSGEHK